MSKLLLIVTNSFDSHADLFERQAHDAGLKLIRFNTDKLGNGNSIELIEKEIVLHISGDRIDNDHIGAVWFRKPHHWWFELSDEFQKLNPQTKHLIRYKRSQVSGMMTNYLYQMKRCGISILPDPFLANTDYAKLNQLIVAETVGLSIPDTIISSDKNNINQFLIKKKHKAIIKSLASYSADRENTGDTLWQTSRIHIDNFNHYLKNKTLEFPVIVQEAIEPKIDIRVTCVGNTIHATKIEPTGNSKNEIDIRVPGDASLRYSPTDLPDELKKLILEFNQKLLLSYAALDFAYSPEQQKYFFLEVNPYGQYLFIEESTGQPITKSLVDFFSKSLSNGT